MVNEHEIPFSGMPAEVARTVEILAPAGSPIEQVITALRTAALHHAALEDKKGKEAINWSTSGKNLS